MRAAVMLMFLCVAVTCYAEDPLEGLNTVDDTLTLMEKSLESLAWDGGGEVATGITGDDAAGEESPLKTELASPSGQPVGAEGTIVARSAGKGDMVLLPEPGVDNCPP